MCTLTWLASPRGYQVFFNRDELRSRQRALPPQLKTANGVQFIAPQDTDAGGTWIWVNGLGTTLCLLNNYAAEAASGRADWISRGVLVQNLAHLPAEAVLPAINNHNLARYRGFDIVLFGLQASPQKVSWNGTDLTIDCAPQLPVTSSSFDTERIIAQRIDSFRRSPAHTNPTELSLDRFHHLHGKSKGAASICMHRDDARTVSFSHLVVTDEKIEFSYRDGSPCEQGPASSIAILPVTASPASQSIERQDQSQS